jgi:hypothetical protein
MVSLAAAAFSIVNSGVISMSARRKICDIQHLTIRHLEKGTAKIE